jgi:hypothetical protein
MKLEQNPSCEIIQDAPSEKILKLLPKKEQSMIAKGISLELSSTELELMSVDKNKSYHVNAIKEMEQQTKRLENRIAILRQILNNI